MKLSIEKAAKSLNVSLVELTQYFVAKLGNDEPLLWSEIPEEYQPLLDIYHSGLSTVVSQPEAEVTVQVKKQRGRPKKTMEMVNQQRETIQVTQKNINQTLTDLTVAKGKVAGAKRAAIESQVEITTYESVRISHLEDQVSLVVDEIKGLVELDINSVLANYGIYTSANSNRLSTLSENVGKLTSLANHLTEVKQTETDFFDVIQTLEVHMES